MIINREQVMYLVFGVLTTVVNLAVFYVAYNVLGLTVLVSNTVAWILAVLFAFVTNRTMVFRSEVRGFSGIMRECAKFFGGRLFSLGLESVLLWLLIDLIRLPVNPVKILTTVIVVVVNYFVSKFFVFKSRKEEEKNETV